MGFSPCPTPPYLTQLAFDESMAENREANHMFWRPVGLIVGLRGRLAGRALNRSTTLMGALMGLIVLGPAALAVARNGEAALRALPPGGDAREPVLRGLLSGAYLLWLLVLGRGVALGQDVSARSLRVFPVRFVQIALGATLGALLDVSLLLALPVLAMLVRVFGHNVTSGALVLGALGLLFFQMAALGQAVSQAGAAFLRPRGLVAIVLLFGALWGTAGYAAGTPAFAAVAGGDHKRAAATRLSPSRPGEAEAARALRSLVIRALPPGLAAQGIVAAGRGDMAGAAGPLVLLAGWAAATLGAAAGLMALVAGRDNGNTGGRTRRRGPPLRPAAKTQTGESRPAGPWNIVAAVAGQEMRGFARDPLAYAGLHPPAVLLLLLVLAWMQPNLGSDAIRNAGDLLGIGALLYFALWQLQWLTNRLGTDNHGRAAMLLRFPAGRAGLLAGKNLALGGVLLVLDTAALALLCLVAAHAPFALFARLVGWLLCTLVVLSALGNLVSVWRPFALTGRAEGTDGAMATGPDRSLAWVYVGVGLATTALLQPVAALLRMGGALALPGVFAYLAAVYLACLQIAAATLVRREARIVRQLERGA